MHVGERLAERLADAGVRRVFGVPGGQTTPLYHGIGSQAGISHVLVRDERSGSFAADAYARVSGRVGACDATVGPGASNLVSGLLEAYTCSVPVLAIVGDIPRPWEHRRVLGSASQGFAQRQFLEPCVKYYARVELPESLDTMLAAAFRAATSNRPGPVVLEVPDDVLSGRWASESAVLHSDAAYPRHRTAPDPAVLRRSVQVLAESRLPMILAGGGVHISGAHEELRRLAEQIGAPVATTLNGKGAISETHPLSVGVSGSFGMPHVNELLSRCDVVLMVGTKAGQGPTLNWNLPTSSSAVIHVDVDGEELGRNFSHEIGVQADALLAISALREALPKQPWAEWDLGTVQRAVCSWWTDEPTYGYSDPDDIKPQDVVRSMAVTSKDRDLLVTDASLSSGWGATHWRTRSAGRRFLAPRGLAGLGWGLPAAIGAAIALRDSGSDDHVFCLAGDGGWAYSQSELETAVRHKLPITSVVLNNSTLGWTKHSAQNRYPDSMPVSQDFGPMHVARMAKAMGAHGVRISDVRELRDAVAEARSLDGPSVVEVVSSPFESPVLTGGERVDAY